MGARDTMAYHKRHGLFQKGKLAITSEYRMAHGKKGTPPDTIRGTLKTRSCTRSADVGSHDVRQPPPCDPFRTNREAPKRHDLGRCQDEVHQGVHIYRITALGGQSYSQIRGTSRINLVVRTARSQLKTRSSPLPTGPPLFQHAAVGRNGVGGSKSGGRVIGQGAILDHECRTEGIRSSIEQGIVADA